MIDGNGVKRLYKQKIYYLGFYMFIGARNQSSNTIYKAKRKT